MATQFVGLVSVMGEQFSWQFPVNFATTLTATRDALTAAALDSRESRQLPDRWVFFRALQSWVQGHSEGAYDHKLSAVIASRLPDEPKNPVIRVQIDRKMIDTIGSAGAEVKYLKECTIELNRATGQVTATDSAVESLIRMSFAYHRESRDGTDCARIIHRLMEKQLGVLGLIPWNGRGTYFVLDSHRATLDKVSDFIGRIGGTVTRIGQFHIVPHTPQGSATQPTGTAVGNQPQVAECIVSRLIALRDDLKTEVLKFNRREYERDGMRTKAAQGLAEQMSDALQSIGNLKGIITDKWESLNDDYLYVRHLLDVGAKSDPRETSAPCISDEDDTVLDCENPVVAETPHTVQPADGADYRGGSILTAVYVAAPSIPLTAIASIPDVRKGETPIPGMDYIGDDGYTYRAPRLKVKYEEMVSQIAMTA